MQPRTLVSAAVTCFAVASAACGGVPDATSDPAAERPTASPVASAQTGIDGDAVQRPAEPACTGVGVEVHRMPLAFVVVFDRSASMGGTKWQAATSGLSAFFEAASDRVSASLTLFPRQERSCDGAFQVPDVPIAPLPSTAFRSKLDATGLLLGTPTRPALEGALTYARTLRNGTFKDGRVVIGLVTDGAPSAKLCTENANADVVKVAGVAHAEGILTYAIGMSGAIQANMDAIAAAGGTKSATMLDDVDPAGQLTRAFDGIRERFACDVGLPSAPDGRSYPFDQVNVVVSAANSAQSKLAYSSDCSDPNGWRYDDPATPSRVVLCTDACASAERGGAIKVELGCPTVGDIR